MPRSVIALAVVTAALAGVSAPSASAQDWTRREFPLAPPNASGNFVAPYFDGYYQNEDGSVAIPDVLLPYMGGLKKIEPRSA